MYSRLAKRKKLVDARGAAEPCVVLQLTPSTHPRSRLSVSAFLLRCFVYFFSKRFLKSSSTSFL